MDCFVASLLAMTDPNSFVVPANAGTHNHWRLWLRKVSTSASNTNSTAYGSLRSQGRRNRVRQAARPSLRAERSNPSRRKESIDCFVASLLAMTDPNSFVVRANAGTHNHWRWWLRKVSTSASNTNSTAYGSLRSQGRRNRVRQAARPSLRAERSNPSRRKESIDCFVASLLAMTDPNSFVVRANAGTHNHWRWWLRKVSTSASNTNSTAYGSLRSQGRRNRVRQAARPSLRAERSNPSRRKESMDCFVASLLAMTDPNSFVVPANAGTHNHWRWWLRKVSTSASNTNSTAYGSLRSQGRCNRVRQAARPSLRAERSNPSRRKESMDCFVASLLAMTDPNSFVVPANAGTHNH